MAWNRISVNLRLLIGSLVALVVIGGLAYLLHEVQWRRNSAAILDMANSAEEEGQNDRALRFLGQYVQRVPTDTETMTRFGTMLESQASVPARRSARRVFEQVLIRDPGRTEVRRRAALLAIQDRDFDAARPHLESLVKDLPDDAEVNFSLGLCYEANRNFASAATYYQRARKTAPDHVASHARLARLVRGQLVRPKTEGGQEEYPNDGERIIQEMVDANPKAYQAYLARAQYHLDQTFENPEDKSQAIKDARKDVSKALELAPEEPTVLLVAADVDQMQGGDLATARGHLQKLLAKFPGDAVVYESLANLELRDGHPDKAMEVLRDGWKKARKPTGLLWELTHLLIQQGSFTEAQQNIDQLERMDSLGQGRLEFLKAAKKIREGDWLEGSRMLEIVRPYFVGQASLVIQADYLLAECYENLGEPDQAMSVLRRIINLDPLQQRARLALAATLARQQGTHDEALVEYERLTKLEKPPESALMARIRLLIAQNLRLPKEQQQPGWERIQGEIGEFRKKFPTSVNAILAEVRVLSARGENDQARKRLQEARKEKPKEVSLWLSEAELDYQQGKPDLAEKVLADAEKQLGDLLAFRQARMVIAISRGHDAGLAELRKLEAGADKFKPDEQAELYTGLGQAARELREPSAARTWWEQAAKLQPRNLSIRFSLFELALEREDETAARTMLQEIQSIEGPSRPLGSFAEARLDLWLASSRSDSSHLNEARSLLTIVEKRRPNWPPLWRARAQVAELLGNYDEAINNYQRAIDLGERDLNAVRRVLQLLFDKRRYAEADLVLGKLPEQVIAAAQLEKMATEFSIQQGNYEEALERARRAIPKDSKDYRDHIWLGQVQWAAGKPQDARAALSKAIELAPDKPDGWIAMVQMLARSKKAEDLKEAEKVIEQAKSNLAKDQAALTLAQCYAILKNNEKAGEFYQAALREKPNDLPTLQSAAEFYLGTGQFAEAEKELRAVVAPANQKSAEFSRARRLLAIVLVTGSDYARKREAAAMLRQALESKDVSPTEAVLDSRTLALVLATFLGRSENEEAVHILEKLEQRKTLTSEDRFLLAQLYDRLGETQKLAKCFQILLVESPDSSRYLAYFIRVLLRQAEALPETTRQNKLDEIDGWLATLDRMAPKDLGVLELKARRSKLGEANARFEQLLKDVQVRDPAVARNLGEMCEKLEDYDRAEQFYRRYANQAKEPQATLVLAAYLGRRKKLSEAFDLCEKAWSTCMPEEVAGTEIRLLRSAGPQETQLQRLQNHLNEALRKEQSISLLLPLASVAELRGKYDEAEQIYRRVLNMNARRADAMNNLAWALIQQDQRKDEALEWVQRAVEALGPIPELLDTRAVVYLALGQPDQAIADLNEAVNRPGIEPRLKALVQFHLARAYQQKGDAESARTTLEQAQKTGLKAETLAPLDRAALVKLAQDLGVSLQAVRR